MIEEIAPAKVNLFLHVGPVRADGLHEIFSLLVFAQEGDRLKVEAASALSLKVAGPFSAALAGLAPEDNLVWRAATKLQSFAAVNAGAAMALHKRLPVAAGIGGGSSDAAAALRALVRLWDIKISGAALRDLAFALGADVPACLDGRPAVVSGAGEGVAPGPDLPRLWICLVNPRVELSTGPVFRAFDAANPNPPPPHQALPAKVDDYGGVAALLQSTRNDLEPCAYSMAPQIRDVLQMLNKSGGVIGARMSGSGATCYGLYASMPDAERAARSAVERGWWSMAAPVAAGPPGPPGPQGAV